MFELSPAIKLLNRKLSLNHVDFLFESLNLVYVVGPDVISIKQLDIPNFVNFTGQFNILLDVVDFLILQFWLRRFDLFHLFLLHLIALFVVKLLVMVKTLVSR